MLTYCYHKGEIKDQDTLIEQSNKAVIQLTEYIQSIITDLDLLINNECLLQQ